MSQSNSGKLLGFIGWLGMALLGASPLVFGETCGLNGFGPGGQCCDAVASTTVGTCFAPANTKYEFSLKRFGFEKSDGSIVFVGANTTFNAASVSIAADMANFVTAKSLPVGAYVAVRPEVSQTMTVNGGGQSEHTTTDSGVPNCSSGGDQPGTLSVDDSNSAIPTCSASPNADMCVTSDGFIRARDTSLGTFTISETSAITIRFAFDVGSGLIFTTGGGACTFSSMGPLSVTMTQQ